MLKLVPTPLITNLELSSGVLKLVDENSKSPQYQLLVIVDNSEITEVDSYCLFYGQLSKVLEINGNSVKIKTTTIVTEEDAETINSIKGKVVEKEKITKLLHKDFPGNETKDGVLTENQINQLVQKYKKHVPGLDEGDIDNHIREHFFGEY